MSIDAPFAPYKFPAVGNHTDEEAAVRGHAAGYAAGRKRAEEEFALLKEQLLADAHAETERLHGDLSDLVTALERAVAAVRSRDALVIEAAERAISAASVEIAEAILGQELSSGSIAARSAIERALSEAGAAALAIRLSPADVHVASTLAITPAGVEIVPDAALDRGDAVVELANGTIDARISSALSRVREALAEGSE